MSDEGMNPKGPLAWVSLALWLLVGALILAWVWAGDWRYGGTAGVVLLAAITTLGLSMSRPSEKGQQ